MTSLTRRLVWILPALAVTLLAAGFASSQVPARGHGAEAQDMELVGHDDLQGRSAYQPTIHRQGGRVLAYVGHHGGRARNPLTGAEEDNGTSIVDVTDPARPRYLTHIPGMAGGPEQGGAQMARVCDRQGKTYLLRTFGNSAPNSGHEVWDVTDPLKPQKASTVVTGLTSTHKNWWECDTGIAYLISGDLAKADPLAGRRVGLAHRTHDEDLRSERSHQAGLRARLRAGGPGAAARPPRAPSRPARTGRSSSATACTSRTAPAPTACLQIVDRQKLLAGPKEPTAANLNAPEISRLYMSPNWGGHTAFPVLGMKIADWASNTKGQTRDFVVLVSEAIANECREFRQASFMVDITTETRPFSVATFQVPEAKGSFCRRGGRFGPHSSSESFAPIFYRKMVFVAYFNGGVRAVDIRDPYAPREAGFYIPATTERTAERCVSERRREAARWRSRPTTSRPTSAASSTWPTAPTPACTSSASPARRPRSSAGIDYMGGLERAPQAPRAARRRPGGAVAPLDTATQAARSRRTSAGRRPRA